MTTFAWCGPQPGGARDDQHCHLCLVEYVSPMGVTIRCGCPEHVSDEEIR